MLFGSYKEPQDWDQARLLVSNIVGEAFENPASKPGANGGLDPKFTSARSCQQRCHDRFIVSFSTVLT